MEQVNFKWISRAKFEAIAHKDPNTIYFIYNEHVLYKGDWPYGSMQSIAYVIDEDGNYIITITDSDHTAQLKVASSVKLKSAIETLQEDLDTHKATLGDEDTTGHVKLTDTINGENPKDVNDSTAVTPKAVADYVSTEAPKQFLQFDTYIDFPIVGKPNTLYLAKDSGLFYTYENNAWVIRGDNWRTIKQINAIIN